MPSISKNLKDTTWLDKAVNVYNTYAGAVSPELDPTTPFGLVALEDTLKRVLGDVLTVALLNMAPSFYVPDYCSYNEPLPLCLYVSELFQGQATLSGDCESLLALPSALSNTDAPFACDQDGFPLVSSGVLTKALSVCSSIGAALTTQPIYFDNYVQGYWERFAFLLLFKENLISLITWDKPEENLRDSRLIAAIKYYNDEHLPLFSDLMEFNGTQFNFWGGYMRTYSLYQHIIAKEPTGSGLYSELSGSVTYYDNKLYHSYGILDVVSLPEKVAIYATARALYRHTPVTPLGTALKACITRDLSKLPEELQWFITSTLPVKVVAGSRTFKFNISCGLGDVEVPAIAEDITDNRTDTTVPEVEPIEEVIQEQLSQIMNDYVRRRLEELARKVQNFNGSEVNPDDLLTSGINEPFEIKYVGGSLIMTHRAKSAFLARNLKTDAIDTESFEELLEWLTPEARGLLAIETQEVLTNALGQIDSGSIDLGAIVDIVEVIIESEVGADAAPISDAISERASQARTELAKALDAITEKLPKERRERNDNVIKKLMAAGDTDLEIVRLWQIVVSTLLSLRVELQSLTQDLIHSGMFDYIVSDQAKASPYNKFRTKQTPDSVEFGRYDIPQGITYGAAVGGLQGLIWNLIGSRVLTADDIMVLKALSLGDLSELPSGKAHLELIISKGKHIYDNLLAFREDYSTIKAWIVREIKLQVPEIEEPLAFDDVVVDTAVDFTEELIEEAVSYHIGVETALTSPLLTTASYVLLRADRPNLRVIYRLVGPTLENVSGKYSWDDLTPYVGVGIIEGYATTSNTRAVVSVSTDPELGAVVKTLIYKLTQAGYVEKDLTTPEKTVGHLVSLYLGVVGVEDLTSVDSLAAILFEPTRQAMSGITEVQQVLDAIQRRDYDEVQAAAERVAEKRRAHLDTIEKFIEDSVSSPDLQPWQKNYLETLLGFIEGIDASTSDVYLQEVADTTFEDFGSVETPSTPQVIADSPVTPQDASTDLVLNTEAWDSIQAPEYLKIKPFRTPKKTSVRVDYGELLHRALNTRTGLTLLIEDASIDLMLQNYSLTEAFPTHIIQKIGGSTKVRGMEGPARLALNCAVPSTGDVSPVKIMALALLLSDPSIYDQVKLRINLDAYTYGPGGKTFPMIFSDIQVVVNYEELSTSLYLSGYADEAFI